MNDVKLKEALQKQDEYLFFWGILKMFLPGLTPSMI